MNNKEWQALVGARREIVREQINEILEVWIASKKPSTSTIYGRSRRRQSEGSQAISWQRLSEGNPFHEESTSEDQEWQN